MTISDPLSDMAGQMLYHGIPVATQGDAIQTSLNYGAEIPQNVKDALGIIGDAKTPLVFAATRLSKALAFGFSYSDKEILLNAAVSPAREAELVVVCNGNFTMTRPRSIAIYSFLGDGFVQLPNADSQCVSRAPVPFSKTEKVLEAKNAEDLMRAGLQVFAYTEPFEEVIRFDYSKAMKRYGSSTFSELLVSMAKDSKIIWENQSRGINPDPVLLEEFDVAPRPQRRVCPDIPRLHQ